MCKFNPKNDGRRMDPCMKKFIKFINGLSTKKYPVKTLSCCCGHGKYPLSIVCKVKEGIIELVGWKKIPRKKKFYKRDKQGYYYIPEVTNGN